MSDFFAPSTYWKSQTHAPFKMFNVPHIIVIVAMVAAIALMFVFGKKIKHNHIKTYLIVSFFVWILLEITKITLFLSTSGDTYQALREVLPLFMCSLFIYMLPLAAFCRNKLKEIGEYTLTTLCLLSGLLTTINCPALYNYPAWSFYSLHSMLYHAFMAMTGVLLLASGYTKLTWKKFFYPLIPVFILAVPAIIMNNVVDTDYMIMRYAYGTPVLEPIAKAIGQVPQIFLMFFVYTLMAFSMTFLGVGIKKLLNKRKQHTVADPN